MTTPEIVKAMIEALEKNDIPYMVVGSFSSNFYGISRFTLDLDLVVELAASSIEKLAESLGSEFLIDPQTTFETATFSIRNLVTVKDSPFKIELFHLKDDDHDRERFQRRVRKVMENCTAFMATAEDVIITKLRWLLRINRPKDRDDIKGVIASRKDKLDWPYVELWCDRHGTRPLLDEIRKSIG